MKLAHAHQKHVRRKFRKICGVTESAPWPHADEIRDGPAPGEDYYTPDFSVRSTHHVNQEIFDRVASLLMEELEDPNQREDELRHPSVYFNAQTIKALAKKAWDGFKVQARAARDPTDHGTRRLANQAKSRRLARRVADCHRLRGIAPQYEQRTGRDPLPLLEVDWLPLYVSSPEKGSNESKEQWRQRMGRAAGMPHDAPGMTAARFNNLKLWERVRQGWSSRQHAEIIDDLDKLWWELASDTDKQRFTGIRINTTGWVSNAPPSLAPFDFMICKKWWDELRQMYIDHISDWFEHGNPTGWEDTPNDADAKSAGEDESNPDDSEEAHARQDAHCQAHDQEIEELYEDEETWARRCSRQANPNLEDAETHGRSPDSRIGSPSGSSTMLPPGPTTSSSGGTCSVDRTGPSSESEGSTAETSVNSAMELDITDQYRPDVVEDDSDRQNPDLNYRKRSPCHPLIGTTK
ncbi:hypothetical protein OE88DRAFT_1738021 [Heliocybe sulcata]|uniref:Uncharacterized protein n=1 Tax=Heliocybe sulcata TaxID=5364 RepID=A0A5C3MSH5_9AGAM|nr:hypothetical protein OE88DRAFT_1738021 [Heliocybe sulcata]